MKKHFFKFFIAVGLIGMSNQGFCQDDNTKIPLFPFYVDYVMGPFLFVDNIAYDAVFMNGCRLGFNIKRNFDFSI